MTTSWLVITAVEAEAATVRGLPDVDVVVAGIGRVNAAAATTQALLERPKPRGVLSIGIAGALPSSELSIGDLLVADSCVYVEEGLLTPTGFLDMAEMGFPLGDFPGNVVPVHDTWLTVLDAYRRGPIATVATCSGTDERAAFIVRRSGALAEAMEGAAVVHAAQRLGVPGLEVRAISNTTGRRDRQQWNIAAALARLESEIPRILDRLAQS